MTKTNEEIVDEFWEKYDYGDTFQMTSMMEWIRQILTQKDKEREEAVRIARKEEGYANGYKQGKFDAQMDTELDHSPDRPLNFERE